MAERGMGKMFALGKVKVSEEFEKEFWRQGRIDLASYLKRHQRGDYGSIPAHEKIRNDVEAKHLGCGGWVISEYAFPDGGRFWLSSDGRETVFMLPDEL